MLIYAKMETNDLFLSFDKRHYFLAFFFFCQIWNTAYGDTAPEKEIKTEAASLDLNAPNTFEFLKINTKSKQKGPQFEDKFDKSELPHSVMWYGHTMTSSTSMPNILSYNVNSLDSPSTTKSYADTKKALESTTKPLKGHTKPNTSKNSIEDNSIFESSDNINQPTTYRPLKFFDRASIDSLNNIANPNNNNNTKSLGIYMRKDIVDKIHNNIANRKALGGRGRLRRRKYGVRSKRRRIFNMNDPSKIKFKARNKARNSTASPKQIMLDKMAMNLTDENNITQSSSQIHYYGEKQADDARIVRQIAHNLREITDGIDFTNFDMNRFKRLTSERLKDIMRKKMIMNGHIPNVEEETEMDEMKENMMKMIMFMKNGVETSTPSHLSNSIETSSPSTAMFSISSPVPLKNRNYLQDTINKYISNDLIIPHQPLHTMHGPPYDHYHNAFAMPPPHIVLQEPYFHTISQTSITNPPLHSPVYDTLSAARATTIAPTLPTTAPVLYRSTTERFKEKLTSSKPSDPAIKFYSNEPFFQHYDPMPQRYSKIRTKQPRNNVSNSKKGKSLSATSNAISDDNWYTPELSKSHFGGSNGQAGLDFPSYSRIPTTSFTCDDHEAGIYGDQEAGCQVWHICEMDGRQHSFLCPNSTIFNQQLLTCDWWYNTDCDQAHNYYKTGPNNEVFKSNKITEEKKIKPKPLRVDVKDEISAKILKQKPFPKKLIQDKTHSKIRSFHVTQKPNIEIGSNSFVEFKPYLGNQYPMFQLRHRRSHSTTKKRKPKPHRLKPTNVINNVDIK